MHPLCHFKQLLPLDKNHSIDLQNKSTGWFLYNGNTCQTPPFSYIIFDLIENILHPIPKLTRLISLVLNDIALVLNDESFYHAYIPSV